MGEDFESFDNLDDLDWSDVEEELKQNKQQILDAAGGDEPQEVDLSALASTADISESPETDGAMDINFLLDVQLQISVEVGRCKMLIMDLLKLDAGHVVELQSLLGQPLDIRVNEKLVARGEIVVINDKFGVRITEIISPDDRFAALQ
ncbi:MAG: flagellar motor switch protein FliN [SAR324 cluster bacterium]|nr:flagellar motor switch protein FliN [SAR324 cluster bacterium]